MPTIGLIGATGQLGQHLVRTLGIRAYAAERITLDFIVLHRYNADVWNVPHFIEQRVFDFDDLDDEQLERDMKDITVLINATKQTPEGAIEFIEKLARVKTPELKVYIPSFFTANWTDSEAADEANVYLHAKCALRDKAIALGLPVTTISNGLFESAFMDGSFSGLDPKNNKMTLYGDAMTRRLSFVALPYLAEAITQIILLKDFGPGKNYTVVGQEFTGREVAEAFEAVHGTKPEIIKMTDEDVERMRKEGPLSGLAAAWRMHWGKGKWNVKDGVEDNLFVLKGKTHRSLKEAVEDALKENIERGVYKI